MCQRTKYLLLWNLSPKGNAKSQYQSLFREGYCFKLLTFVALIVTIVSFLGLSLFIEIVAGGYVKPSLGLEYISTAEYLLDNTPHAYFSNLTSEKQIPVTVQLKTTTDSYTDYIVMDLVLWEDVGIEPMRWSEIYINNQLIDYRTIIWSRVIVYTLPTYTSFSIPAELDAGLHLVEVRIRQSPFSPPQSTSIWALEIE